MTLLDKEYRALEDIVGEEYITREPAILDTYNQCWGHRAVFDQKWSNRPAAVILPGNTEELQALVRAFNRYHIPFKPFSSGFEIVSLALASERGVLLDLKRMDRILEIDVQNMRAVVEPYVGIYRLQRELTKYGLTTGAVGCGPSAGVVATSCCHFGAGTTMVSTGGLGRSVLGVEWVLPTGELVQLGSAECGAGRFSADGPGPSLRGLMRGRSGANGGHGIITKASVKLYPWHDYKDLEFQGEPGMPPSAKRMDIPEGYKLFCIFFPNKEDTWEAYVRIGRAEIATAVTGTMLFPYGEGNDEQWAEIQKLMEAGLADAQLTTTSITVVLGSATQRGMEYREKYLMRICEELGGQIMPLTPFQEKQMFGVAVLHFGLVTAALRGTGDFFVNPTHDATMDMMKQARKPAIDIIGPHLAKGTVFQFGKEPDMFITVSEHNSVGAHDENITVYDPWDPESLEALRDIAAKSENPKGPMGSFGIPHLGGGLQIEFTSHTHQNWGPVYENYDVWLREIKKALDPNNLGDWSAYVPPIYP